MAKIRDMQVGSETRHLFWCPGCKTHMWFDSRWTWNGNYESPTAQPSIKWSSGNAQGPTVCHLFMENGQIRFLGDCTHEFVGKTVPLEDIDW